MTSSTKPILRRKLSDAVEDRLLEMIRSGNFAPGDPIPSERELMKSYEVGRPAIREAMQNLQRMGLIEIRHGERPRVAEPSLGRMMDQTSETMRHILTHSPASLEHLKEARATFELEMVRIAARKHSRADIVRLARIVDDQERASQDSPRFLECDGLFHREIAAISGNPIFASVCEAMFRWLANFHMDLVRRPGLEQLTLDEHREIIGAIETGNAKTAAKAMSNHLNRANALYHQQHYVASSGT